jgi:hypothetical protein
MTDFQARGVAAWDDFLTSREARPYPIPKAAEDGESRANPQAPERRYLSR